MKATYTKLKQGWGIRVKEGKPSPGQTVVVTKKSGEKSQEVVSKVLWKGKDRWGDGMVYLCSIKKNARPRKSTSGCHCSQDCCQHGCRCESYCVCKGGTVFDC